MKLICASPELCIIPDDHVAKILASPMESVQYATHSPILFNIAMFDKFDNALQNDDYHIHYTLTCVSEKHENINSSELQDFFAAHGQQAGLLEDTVCVQWSGTYEAQVHCCGTFSSSFVIHVASSDQAAETQFLHQALQEFQTQRKAQQVQQAQEARYQLEQAITEQVQEWTQNRTLRQLMNEITIRYVQQDTMQAQLLLPVDANDSDLKRVYKKLALFTHPDRTQNSQDTTEYLQNTIVFQQLQQAYKKYFG